MRSLGLYGSMAHSLAMLVLLSYAMEIISVMPNDRSALILSNHFLLKRLSMHFGVPHFGSGPRSILKTLTDVFPNALDKTTAHRAQRNDDRGTFRNHLCALRGCKSIVGRRDALKASNEILTSCIVLLVNFNEARFLQNAEVSGDTGLVDINALNDIIHRALTLLSAFHRSEGA